MTEFADYGPVIILKGKHKGTIGYYDDDEGNRGAVVYLKPYPDFYNTDHILLDHKHIKRISSIETEKFIQENPFMSKHMDIRSR